MLCRNGLHEIDPDDSWRASNGARCRACKKTTWKRNGQKYSKSEKGRASMMRRNRGQKLKGKQSAGRIRYIARFPERARANQKKYLAHKNEDPAFRQMRNDTRRLGISSAEWRRQVAQGIIQLKGA